jgi:hypothetical protein
MRVLLDNTWMFLARLVFLNKARLFFFARWLVNFLSIMNHITWWLLAIVTMIVLFLNYDETRSVFLWVARSWIRFGTVWLLACFFFQAFFARRRFLRAFLATIFTTIMLLAATVMLLIAAIMFLTTFMLLIAAFFATFLTGRCIFRAMWFFARILLYTFMLFARRRFLRA